MRQTTWNWCAFLMVMNRRYVSLAVAAISSVIVSIINSVDAFSLIDLADNKTRSTR